jgi:hypothetical protein
MTFQVSDVAQRPSATSEAAQGDSQCSSVTAEASAERTGAAMTGAETVRACAERCGSARSFTAVAPSLETK